MGRESMYVIITQTKQTPERGREGKGSWSLDRLVR